MDAELLILRAKADALSYGGKASLVRRKQQIQNGGDERVSPEKETGQSAAFVSLQFPDTFPINVLYFFTSHLNCGSPLCIPISF